MRGTAGSARPLRRSQAPRPRQDPSMRARPRGWCGSTAETMVRSWPTPRGEGGSGGVGRLLGLRTARPYLKGRERFPSPARFAALRARPVGDAAHRHGGIGFWAAEFDVTHRRHPGRPREHPRPPAEEGLPGDLKARGGRTAVARRPAAGAPPTSPASPSRREGGCSALLGLPRPPASRCRGRTASVGRGAASEPRSRPSILAGHPRVEREVRPSGR